MLTPYGVGVLMFVWVLGRPFFTMSTAHASLILGLNGCCLMRRKYVFNLKLKKIATVFINLKT